MRKSSFIFLVGILIGLFISTSVVVFAANQIKIVIDGKEIKPDVPTQIINGRVMVPARFIAEPLGAKVDWDEIIIFPK